MVLDMRYYPMLSHGIKSINMLEALMCNGKKGEHVLSEWGRCKFICLAFMR